MYRVFHELGSFYIYFFIAKSDQNGTNGHFQGLFLQGLRFTLFLGERIFPLYRRRRERTTYFEILDEKIPRKISK